MKKVLAAVLAAMILISAASVCVWAETETNKEPEVWKITSSGMDITVPEKWTESGRYFSYRPYEAVKGAYLTNFVMYDATYDELVAAEKEFAESEEEYVAWLENRINDLTMIASIEDSLGADDFLKEIAAEAEVTVEELNVELVELGKADGWTFYEVRQNDQSMYRRPTPAEGTEEAVAMVFDALPEMMKNIKFYAPVPDPKTEEGTKISFKTVDFEGREVDSSEIFAKNKYTMINLWMSWCSFCVQEMPELEKMNKELAKDGCGIIAVMLDGDKDDKLEVGKSIVADAGVTFPVLVPNDQMKEQLIANSFPTTVFVDSEGVVIGDPIVGMDVQGYKERMEALISGEFKKADEKESSGSADQKAADDAADKQKADDSADQKAADDAASEKTDADSADSKAADKASAQKTDSGYIVMVQDEAGQPVEDVMVQFCSDSKCMMKATEEDGTASFDAEGGVYAIHIVDVPDGFAEDAEEYKTTEMPGTVVITLKRQ